MTRRFWWVAAVALAACTSSPPPVTYATPSGEPEVTIAAPTDSVRDRLAAYLVGNRFTITRSDDYTLAASIRLLETPLPIVTLSYALVPVPGGTRVIGHVVQTNAWGAEDVTHERNGRLAQIALRDVANSFVR